MPKTINWETQEISFYKFVCKNPDILFSYVGHTVSFRGRKSSHKSSCNNLQHKDHNSPVYVFMRENGGFENWNMIVIHTQICKDKRDAERIENELMEQQQFKLNARKAFVAETKQEYYAEYYEEHKEHITKRVAGWLEQNKAKLAMQAAKRYQNNKAQLAIKRAENRDVINAKQRAKRALQKAQLNCEILDATNP
jgi:hypothetical protein